MDFVLVELGVCSFFSSCLGRLNSSFQKMVEPISDYPPDSSSPIYQGNHWTDDSVSITVQIGGEINGWTQTLGLWA